MTAIEEVVKDSLTTFLGLIVVLLLSACGNQSPQKLVITGSSTVAPLAADLAAAYEAVHPGVEIDVQSGGSSRGINDTRNGLADIGMASRPLKPGERDLRPHAIALDGITLISNRDNPVRNLSHDQVVDIYTGRIDNWSQLGGPEKAITVISKAEGHSTLELFLEHFDLKSAEIENDVIIGDNQQGLKIVAGNTWAVAYVSIGSAEYEAAHGQAIRLLSLDNTPASAESLKSGDFPLSRPLNLVTRSDTPALALKFIEFSRSQAAHALIEKHYFNPVQP